MKATHYLVQFPDGTRETYSLADQDTHRWFAGQCIHRPEARILGQGTLEECHLLSLRIALQTLSH